MPVIRRVYRAIRQVTVQFVAPLGPTRHALAREQFQKRAGAALLDDLMQLGRLARVLFLASREEIDLRSAGL